MRTGITHPIRVRKVCACLSWEVNSRFTSKKFKKYFAYVKQIVMLNIVFGFVVLKSKW